MEGLPDAVRAGHNVATEVLGEPYFARLGSDPHEARVFGTAMRDLSGLVEADAEATVDVGDARQVVDLGGGSGRFLAAILRANPAARGTVLELAHVVHDADTSPPPGVGDRLRFQAGDFFDEVPAADYYVLKLVLHDWDDDECVRLLTACRRAARPGSRLLVVEALVGEGDDTTTLDLGALMDMTMLVMMSGRERRLSDYDQLFARAGWIRTEMRPTRSIYSLVELVPTADA